MVYQAHTAVQQIKFGEIPVINPIEITVFQLCSM